MLIFHERFIRAFFAPEALTPSIVRLLRRRATIVFVCVIVNVLINGRDKSRDLYRDNRGDASVITRRIKRLADSSWSIRRARLSSGQARKAKG